MQPEDAPFDYIDVISVSSNGGNFGRIFWMNKTNVYFDETKTLYDFWGEVKFIGTFRDWVLWFLTP